MSKVCVRWLAVGALVLWGASAIAQPPSQDDREFPEPGQPPAADPGADPQGVAPAAPASQPGAATAPAVTYAVGSRLRGIFVPAWFLEAFMNHAHGLSSVSWGFDFTRRKGNLDLVIGLDIGWYGLMDDANWTGSGSYGEDTFYTQFQGFVFTSIDINWIWHYDFAEWVALRYGGGLGLGFLAGDIHKQQSGPNCTAATVDDLTQCQPGWTATAPAAYNEDLSSYRVLPVVSALLGARFKVHRHAVVTVDGGFHNAFFFGASGQYVF